MDSLFQSGMYGAINTYDITKNELYVIPFISEAYTLQNNKRIDVQVISDGELVSRENIFASCNRTLNGIGNKNHCNILS